MTVGGRLLRCGIVAACALVLGSGSACGADSTAASNDDVQDLIFLASKGPIVIRLHVRVDGQPFSELRAAVARQLFEILDADGNGVLEGKELDGIPPAELLAAVARRTRGQAASVPRSMKPAPKVRVTPDDLFSYLLPYDISNFALTIDSAQKPVGGYSAPVPPDGYQRTNSLDMISFLAVLDADSDGRVTVTECRRVDELFHKLDLNDDETISRTEIAEVAAAKNLAKKESSTQFGDVVHLLLPMDHSGPRLELAPCWLKDTAACPRRRRHFGSPIPRPIRAGRCAAEENAAKTDRWHPYGIHIGRG